MAAASAVSGTDGSDWTNAGMRARVALTVRKTVMLYATEASTGLTTLERLAKALGVPVEELLE